MNQDFLFIGHRGTRKFFDENTILAFKKAIECGANYIEFDVRKTKDEKLIVIHDSTLNRTTNGSGLVKDITHKEILNFRTKLNRSHIPLLTDVFNEFKGKAKFMIEVKENDLIDDIAKIIIENNLLEDCIISGKNLTDLLEYKEKFPQNEICYNITKGRGYSLTEFLEGNNDKRAKFKIDMINLRSSLISKEFIDVCQMNKILSLSWDFLGYKNPINKIKSLITFGVDGILFDDYKNIREIKRWQSFH